jgi:uncharacterized metal-binding protein
MQQKTEISPACDSCKNKKCRDGKDCFGIAVQIVKEYEGDNLNLARAASRIEGLHYMKKTRLEEIILFSREMKYQKLGIAFCIGLSQEAEVFAEYLKTEFQVVSVCCKVCGIEKSSLHLQKIEPGVPETMCNPIGQAALLNKAETDLNIICGLCIGHDIQFTNYSKAPVTTFIVKDRMLAHNTAASLYNPYLRKRIGLV